MITHTHLIPNYNIINGYKKKMSLVEEDDF